MKLVSGAQLSSAWFQAHCGVVSGSYMASVLDFTKKGEPGATRKTYLRTKLAELLTGICVQDNYVSREMLEGIEREPAARAAYELEMGEGFMVEEIGFALHDTIPRFGGSVDGLVGDDGMIEAKCPKAGTHLGWILAGVVPEQHIPQIDSYLSITGRAWCDFISFCPEVPKPLRLMIIRRDRDQAAIDAIEKAARGFNAEIDAMVERLQAIAPFELAAAQREKESAPEDFGELGLTEEDLAILDR